MKVKGKNKLVLEKYLPRSKTVRMRILWSYDMAMVWICAYLALGLRFDLSLSSVPIEYAREVWKYGLLQMVMVSLVFYAGHLYAIMWGVSGVREMMQVMLACLVAALAQSVGILFAKELLCAVVCADGRGSHDWPGQFPGTSEDYRQDKPLP